MRDAPAAQVTLNVTVRGGGSVLVSAGAECSHDTCTYAIPRNSLVILTAKDHGNNVFEQWQGGACAGEVRSCEVTATSAVTTAIAIFDHEH